MSYCNPNTIEDYFLEPPEDLSLAFDGKKTIKDAKGTPMEFGLKDPAEVTPPTVQTTKAEVAKLHNDLKDVSKQLTDLGNTFARIGFNAKTLEDSYGKIVGPDGAISIGNFFRNFGNMKSAMNSLEQLLGKGLGLENQEWFRNVEKLGEQAGPFIEMANKMSGLVSAIDGGGINLLSDDLLVGLFADITNNLASVFGDDNGIVRALAGIQGLIATAEGIANFLTSAGTNIEDSAIAVLDMAESLMAAGLGLAASICEFIPVFIAMIRATIEMIKGLLAALMAFLLDPLGHLPKFNLDIDFSKLFKLPELDLFRRLKGRWDRFTGTAFKSWKTVQTQCSPDAWNSKIQGPGKISEAATSLSGAMLYGAQLATAAADAPEGIRKVGALPTNLLDSLAAATSLINKKKSLVKIHPAAANPTPSTPELGFKTGTSIPADISAIKLPSGLGALNGAKTFEIDPKTGYPIKPGIQGSVSNHLEGLSDMTGILRAGEITAAATYGSGYSLKSVVTGGDANKALKSLFNNTRRLRYIQSGVTKGDGTDQSLIARDYFACEENAKTSKFAIDSMADAQEHLSTAICTPAGLPGSVMERAAFNNPGLFMTGDNNVGLIKDLEKDTSLPSSDISPTSIIGQLTPGDLSDKTKLTNPDDTIDSPATKRLDELLAHMPLAAMGASYYDSDQLNALSGIIGPDYPKINNLPLLMLANNSAQTKRITQLESLQLLLDSVDLPTAESLVKKATLQGLLEENAYTWLAIGKRLIGNEKLPDLLQEFLLHSRRNFKEILLWLESSYKQNIENPQLPLNLNDAESAVVEKSYRFLQANGGLSIADTFLQLRRQADETGGPLGFEFTLFLVCDTILKEIEDRILLGQDMKQKLAELKPMVAKLTHYKAMAQQIASIEANHDA